MDELKRKLIQRAQEEHEEIFPAGNRTHLSECFTIQKDQLYFWFNTKNQTTRLIAADLQEERCK